MTRRYVLSRRRLRLVAAESAAEQRDQQSAQPAGQLAQQPALVGASLMAVDSALTLVGARGYRSADDPVLAGLAELAAAVDTVASRRLSQPARFSAAVAQHALSANDAAATSTPAPRVAPDGPLITLAPLQPPADSPSHQPPTRAAQVRWARRGVALTASAAAVAVVVVALTTGNSESARPMTVTITSAATANPAVVEADALLAQANQFVTELPARPAQAVTLRAEGRDDLTHVTALLPDIPAGNTHRSIDGRLALLQRELAAPPTVPAPTHSPLPSPTNPPQSRAPLPASPVARPPAPAHTTAPVLPPQPTPEPTHLGFGVGHRHSPLPLPPPPSWLLPGFNPQPQPFPSAGPSQSR